MNIRINHLTIEKLTEKLQTAGGPEKIACLIILSRHYDSCNETRLAMKYAACAFESATELQSTTLIADSYLQIAKVYATKMQYFFSDKNFRTALVLYQGIDHRAGQAKAYYSWGECFGPRTS